MIENPVVFRDFSRICPRHCFWKGETMRPCRQLVAMLFCLVVGGCAGTSRMSPVPALQLESRQIRPVIMTRWTSS